MDPNDADNAWNFLSALSRIAIGLGFLGVYAGSVAWAIGDAQKRGRSGCVVLAFMFIFGPLAAVIWLFVRPTTTLANRPVDAYETADDALAGVAKLDMLGEWNQALALYFHVANRWPEHENYANECINQIERKKRCGES